MRARTFMITVPLLAGRGTYGRSAERRTARRTAWRIRWTRWSLRTDRRLSHRRTESRGQRTRRRVHQGARGTARRSPHHHGNGARRREAGKTADEVRAIMETAKPIADALAPARKAFSDSVAGATHAGATRGRDAFRPRRVVRHPVVGAVVRRRALDHLDERLVPGCAAQAVHRTSASSRPALARARRMRRHRP